MRIWSSLCTTLAFVFRRSQVESEVEQELRSHLRSRADDLERQGLSHAEAERQARLEFGGYQHYKEECREALGTRLLGEVIADVRYGLRQLRRNPGFTAVAVLTLALGIGATTAMFSVVDAVLLRSLPYRDANRLVSLYEDRSSTGFPRKEFTPANYTDCKQHKEIFQDVAAIDADRSYNLTGNGAAPERLWADGVSWNLFSILGTRPLLGRVFRPQEDMPGNEHVVLIAFGEADLAVIQT
jgi:putative ABC transport system permease protein